MKAVNLATLCMAIGNENFDIYEKQLSHREEAKKHKEHELASLSKLTHCLMNVNSDVNSVEGFFFGYTIEQIGKEFDLIKYDKNIGILNVELKSQDVGEEKIKAQLLRNKYYLNVTSNNVFMFTYVDSIDVLYKLDDSNELVSTSFDELSRINSSMTNYCIGGIEALFEVKNYLISPLNTPEKFLAGSYFLTQSQEDVVKKIKTEITAGKKNFGINGAAGTGKTLVLYDLAKQFSNNNRVCIIHCGIKCIGHTIIDNAIFNLSIIEAKEISNVDLSRYDYILIDEAQRLYDSGLDILKQSQSENGQILVFAYDYVQTLSAREENRNIPNKLADLPGYVEQKLSDKIRTNKNMSSFIRNMMDLHHPARKLMDYTDIEVIYSTGVDSAKRIINDYCDVYNYTFINYTQSRYYPNSIDTFGDKLNTHHVIGQEYDNVIIIMDSNFRYGEGGRLQAKIHPNPDYYFHKLLYQALSRCRHKLCIVVIDNYPLLEKLVEIKESGYNRADILTFCE